MPRWSGGILSVTLERRCLWVTPEPGRLMGAEAIEDVRPERRLFIVLGPGGNH